MSIEQIDFKSQVREALERGATYERLKEFVRQCYRSGGTKEEAYKLLEEIWREYGYHDDEHAQPDSKRDQLEYLMERVWYWGE